jgi:hypothetical protein
MTGLHEVTSEFIQNENKRNLSIHATITARRSLTTPASNISQRQSPPKAVHQHRAAQWRASARPSIKITAGKISLEFIKAGINHYK